MHKPKCSFNNYEIVTSYETKKLCLLKGHFDEPIKRAERKYTYAHKL